MATGATHALGAGVVQAIRTADHGTFDRVVVEFRGAFGQWTAGYTDRVVEDPVGDVVPLKGTAFVEVRVQGATFDNVFQVGPGVPHVAYPGPHRIAAGLVNIQEIADSGDFEAVIGLGIGLNHKAGLRAFRMENPSRLVIDIAH